MLRLDSPSLFNAKPYNFLLDPAFHRDNMGSNPIGDTISTMSESRPNVNGVDLDSQTRCAHYNGPLDIIAIKMKCCGIYYACKDCHDELADHAIEVWPHEQWHQTAVLCGSCATELSVRAYLECSSRCPACRASFNPGCRNHYHFYFETEGSTAQNS